MKKLDLTNQKFNKLTVIARSENKWNKVLWKCQCDCGNIVYATTNSLKSGNTKSCGCLRSQNFKAIVTKHHLSQTRIYRIWKEMKKRCYNPKTRNSKYYYARGIKVCEEWKNNFQAFYDWSMQNGYNDKLTIDRIDVNGDYKPSNCRWVDTYTQNNNSRNCHYITYNGETKTLTQWAKTYNINQRTLTYRINDLKWSIGKALTTPPKH